MDLGPCACKRREDCGEGKREECGDRGDQQKKGEECCGTMWLTAMQVMQGATMTNY